MNLADDVTVLLVDGVDPAHSLHALKHCRKAIPFKHLKLFSFDEPSNLDGVQFTKIPKFTWNDYNNFIAHKLADVVDTEFVLVVQTDGFITSPHLWTDEFFEYDYIGAPWPDNDTWLNLQSQAVRDAFNKHHRKVRVGNGGFSLRSKKFIEASAAYPSCNGFGEDVFLSVMEYDAMSAKGIKFAPVELAMRFAIENPIAEMGYNWPSQDANFNTSRSFGFHGVYVTDYQAAMRSIYG